MVDIERQMYDLVVRKVVGEYPKLFCSSEPILKPASFPALEMREIGNTVYTGTSTGSSAENHARITFEITVYSAAAKNYSSECKQIMGVCDATMSSHNFRRTMMTLVPNYNGAGVHRLTARYTGIAAYDGTIYYS